MKLGVDEAAKRWAEGDEGKAFVAGQMLARIIALEQALTLLTTLMSDQAHLIERIYSQLEHIKNGTKP